MAPSERTSRRNTVAGRRARSDRDGDVKMGVEPKVRAGGRIGKSSSTPTGSSARNKEGAARGPRGAGLASSNAQRNILRAAARGDVSMKNDDRPLKQGDLVEFKITGWDKSAAAHSTDGGVNALKKWLESKVSRKLGSASRRQARVKRSRVEGSVLYISVAEADARIIERMNGFSWAKATLSIERVGGPAKLSTDAENTKAMLHAVLETRYNAESKFLDLTALGQDPLLKAQAIFDQKSTASKFFPALMKVLEQAFEKAEERDAAIKSVSLANNDLEDLKIVSTLSFTLPKLENLDLSNNQLAKLQSLEAWRRRFINLQHLIITNNPIEQNEPNYGAELIKWYPNLRMLNQIQVRTEEDIIHKNSVTNIPFPIKSPKFQDEGGIVENFVKAFFNGFDNDRHTLANFYYDGQSTFSMSVNASAPRDPQGTVEQGKGDWESYIKHSRNLKRLNQIGARQSRLARGPQAIADIFAAIPKTKHPDLLAEPRKWMIEAHVQPCIPDPTGQSPAGVDGFSVSIHGEYEELDPQNLQSTKKRSFDHFIQLGPALPGSTAIVRIVSHTMTIRSYGGAQAFDPDHFADNIVARPPTPPQQDASAAPGLPPGLTIPQAEEMLTEFARFSGMTLEYAKMCLDQVEWDAQKAQGAFQQVKGTLPPEAWAAVQQT